jgi:FkbM family methyltransferase
LDHDIKLKLRVRVYEGLIGIGLLTPEGDRFYCERQIAPKEESEHVEIPLPEGTPLGSLVLRNTSTGGSSKADLEILHDEFFAFSQAIAVARLRGHLAFRGLKREKYVTPGGFATNAIGQRTALRFEKNWTYPAEWEEEHFEEPDFPWSWQHEETYEWIALAEAVKDARETFTMVELGAGYGRWLVAGARLARMSRPDLKLKLVGVEAAPAHFQWMREHFEHNDLTPSAHDLIEAVVDAHSGTAYFCDSMDPGSDYGQHVVEIGIQDPARLNPKPVEAIGINDLLRHYEQIDLVDMDIQGHERVVIPAGIEEMTKRVRRVYIGIHEPASIATELTELFTKSGWTNVASFPCMSEVETQFGPISFTDGCQYWVNPRLMRSVT